MRRITDYFKKVIGRIDPLSFAALTAFILLSLTVSFAASPLPGEKELCNGIIRFHVLANSDSNYDQDLKLKVRDEVTKYTTELLEECKCINEAKRMISENSETITAIAQKVIIDSGSNYAVTLKQGMETYPRRVYDNYTFPAGKYYSVRLEIGEAKGKNWWCVLFPPMCLGSATVEKYNDPAALSEIGFSDSEIKIISEEKAVKKEIRFFFLDLINIKK